MEITTTQNKDKYAETKKRWAENNKERLKEYHHNYYLEHKEHMLDNAARWREENVKLDSVYLFLGEEENEVLYVGSSSRFNERVSAHLTNNSNIDLTIEELVDLGLTKIIYKDFTKYGLNRTDLFFLEQYYKDQTEEKIKNKRAFKYSWEEKLSKSKEDLIKIAEKENFIIFEKLLRYLN